MAAPRIPSRCGQSPKMVAENDDSASSSEVTSMVEKAGRNGAAKEDERAEQVNESVDTSACMQEEQGYLKGTKLITVVVCLMLAVFCVALDNTILATAIPRITDSFHRIDDLGWYGSAYLLSTCSFQILYAKFYTFFNVKWVFLTALSTFEIGSLVCAVSPTSNTLIIGRAIAGLGAAGIFTGATTAISRVAPLELRPLIIGLVGGLYGFCSVFGPVLGGVFSDKATWRWCFYINLPFGAITAVGILIFLPVDRQIGKLEGSIFKQIQRFDPIGNTLFISSVICLLLALQWGDTTYPYTDGRIIALFTVFGILLIAFIALEVYNRENATVPTRIIKQRSIALGALFAFCVSSTTFIVVYYLPIWFQVVKGIDPIQSAIHTFPFIFCQLAGTIFSGAMTNKIGYYVPFIWASTVLLPIGAGLLSTFHIGISTAKWVGYEMILGFGIGFGFQQANVAAQVVLPMKDVPTGVAVVFSAMFLGGSVFLSVAENIFTNHLRSNIAAVGIPGFNAERAIKAGAVELRNLVPAKYLTSVLVAYNDAITKAFQLAVIMACLASLGAVGMEWRNMKIKPTASNDEEQT